MGFVNQVFQAFNSASGGFFFSSRRRHTRWTGDWSSDVCSSDLTYEIMRYWDEDLPDWDADDHEFAAAWRGRPKWVVSRSLTSVGPNATLLGDDTPKAVRRLKAERAGEILVGGPVLAQSLTEAGLIDEYRLYLRPVVLGGGTPFFRGPRPPLRLVANEVIAGDLLRVTYVPA